MDIGELLSKYWKYIGRLVSLRLKRSGIEPGIEHVILAGSSFFALSEAKSGLLSSADGLLARATRDFFKDFDFLAPEDANNARPQGRPSEDR